MNLTNEEKTFIDTLDQNRYYRVEGASYSLVRPAEMTARDIRYLMEAKRMGGDITEGSVLFNGQLIL